MAGFTSPPSPGEEAAAAGRAELLGVCAPQPKVTVLTAFRVQRILLSEFIVTGELSPPDAEQIVQYCGVDAVVDHDVRMEPRPVGLCRPNFGERCRDEHFGAWLSEVSEDVAPRVLEGLTVIAGWSRHRSFTRSAELVAGQVHGTILVDDDRSIKDVQPDDLALNASRFRKLGAGLRSQLDNAPVDLRLSLITRQTLTQGAPPLSRGGGERTG